MRKEPNLDPPVSKPSYHRPATTLTIENLESEILRLQRAIDDTVDLIAEKRELITKLKLSLDTEVKI